MKELFDKLKKKYGKGCTMSHEIDDAAEQWTIFLPEVACCKCGNFDFNMHEYSTKEELIKGVEELCNE